MKVLLISPPATNIIRDTLPPVVEDTGAFPPLGLLYVAAYAEAVPGCQVSILDCQAEGIPHDALGARIRDAAPDVIGVQVMTYTLVDAILVAKTARQSAPRASIVFGGPHTTIFPRESVELTDVDAVVVGEGEHAFAALLEALRDKTPLETIPGVLTKQSSLQDARPPRDFITDLDSLKYPARHLLNQSIYFSPLAQARRVTTMMSSRGCPFKCTFCERLISGTRFRKRSARNVFEEMKYCVEEFGTGEIVFYDDTFTVDRARVLELCDMITESGLEMMWDIRARVDTMTAEMIRKLRQAGCVRIHYGVETGSPRLQVDVGKNLDLATVKEVFRLTRKAGIETLGYFMVGFPSETAEELDQTLQLMMSLPMDYSHIAIFTPYPATEIYTKALADGVYDRDYWREFARDPMPGFSPRYWNERLSDEELQAVLKKAYAMFYRRPGYILSRLLKVRSPSELCQKAVLGLRLLRHVSS